MTATDSNTYYETYWTASGFNPTGYVKPEQVRLFQSHLKQGSRCLDVGCGDGRTAGRWILASGRQYVGVDISRTAVEAATAAGLTALHVSSTESLPFPDNSFDHVLCIEVLEHLFAPQGTVCEMYRVLKVGGTLVTTVPNVAYWRRRLELLFLRYWNAVGDNRSQQAPC